MRDLTRPSDEELKQCNNRRTPRQLFHIPVMGKMPESANFPPEKKLVLHSSCSLFGCHAWLLLRLSAGTDQSSVVLLTELWPCVKANKVKKIIMSKPKEEVFSFFLTSMSVLPQSNSSSMLLLPEKTSIKWKV